MTEPSRIVVGWKGERRFEATREGRPPILLDGDSVAAPSPTDALLASLAACVSIDVVDILAKRRTPVETYDVEVVGERVDAVPRRFTHITLNLSVVGAGIERVHAERAVELAVTKYCSVRDSLAKDIVVDWTLKLNE
ncbi:MAG: OsmC family protein [Gemmatimonadaceae bacterium]